MSRRDEGQHQLFISYARADVAIVDALVGELRDLGYQPFFDSDMTGGQRWWDTLLDRIEASDVFLPVLSPHYLDSEACYQETNWAATVGVPFVPIDVARVDPRLCPRAIADANWVRYELEGRSSLARLSHALRTIQPGIRPPVTAPRPDIPMTYYGELEREISGPLDWERQLVVIATLKGRLGTREDALARRLLGELQENPRISYTSWREIEAALKQGPPPADPLSASAAPAPVDEAPPATPPTAPDPPADAAPGEEPPNAGPLGASSPAELSSSMPREERLLPGPPGPGRTGPDEPASARGRGKVLGAAALVALIVGGMGAYALTRPSPDGGDSPTGGPTGMGHDVPISTVVEVDTFGHFGDPDVMREVFESPCTNNAPTDSKYAEVRCTFREHPTFYVDFNNGDPLTTDAHGLPDSIKRPGPNKIVAIQPVTPSLHAYLMTYVAPGVDEVRDTGDDVVELVLYDVDTAKHPGSAEFKSENRTSDPLTRDVANQLLESIGVDETKFPVPEAFELSVNPSSGNSPLRLFAERFLTPDQIQGCVEGFPVVPDESEHVTCCAPEGCAATAVTTSFGLQRESLSAARYRFRSDSEWSWSDDTGLSGVVVPSQTRSGLARLFWFANSGDAAWGLLTARSRETSLNDLRRMFEGFASHPVITT